jgi:hypothetical protein
MKKLMQIIEACWKELIIAAILMVMGHEMIQTRMELESFRDQLKSHGGSGHVTDSDRRSIQPETRSPNSDLRSFSMRLLSLESDLHSIKSRMSSTESELKSLDRKLRY